MTADDVTAVWRCLRASGPSTERETAMRTGLALDVVRDAYRVLIATGFASVKKWARGKLSIRSRVDLSHVLAVIDFDRKRALQVMQPGEGDRRDNCENYAECLGAFAHAHSDDVDAHCPAACERFAPYAEDWRRAGHDSAARKEWA